MFALLPAAGLSTRMGQPKLMLPLRDGTVLECVIDLFHRSGIEKILVVVGPHVSQLVPLAESKGASALLLRESTPDMRSTIEEGFSWIESHWHPTPQDGFFLVPADHPVIDPSVIHQLTDQWHHQSSSSILIPTFEDKRGHPVLISWQHVSGIRSLPKDCGINRYFRNHPELVTEVEVSSDTIFIDLDTPEDYQRLLDQLRDS
jgi:molybdenum cofactor cytidylyltransferase